MPLAPWPKMMPELSQVTPNGCSAEQRVTGAPPLTATFLMVWSVPDQKAIESPLGENTGLKTSVFVTARAISRGSSSDIDRTWSPAFTTYAIWAPS
jgi:hypothetical protein